MGILTVCVPVYNESRFIDRLISSLMNAAPDEKEIILIDGGSTDDTISKIKSWQKVYPQLRLVINDLKYVSHGFNKAYRDITSDYIALLGAHAAYPDNYFEKGVEILKSGLADAVGGTLKQDGRTEKGKIIAQCMSSKFGVGNTEFRTSREKKYVPSVAMAIYKKSVFESIGLLDEELIRNQDDEFHYRMNARGLKILMDPEMELTYFVRDDFASLWSQYYHYGLFKPLVLKKVNSGFRLRHIIPALFVLYIVAAPLLFLMSPVTALPLILYIMLALLFSIRISLKPKKLTQAFIAFTVLHISYGLGFIVGIKKIL